MDYRKKAAQDEAGEDQVAQPREVALAWQPATPEAVLGHARPATASSTVSVPAGVPMIQDPVKPPVAAAAAIPAVGSGHLPPRRCCNHEAPLTGKWSTGLFDCDGFSSGRGCSGDCCLASFCGCVMYGENVAALKPEEACCGSNQQGACWGYCCLEMLPTMLLGAWLIPFKYPGCGCLVHNNTRRSIRHRYGIAGDDCQDCCVTSFCCCCALIQEKRELQLRGAYCDKFLQPNCVVMPTVPNNMNNMN